MTERMRHRWDSEAHARSETSGLDRRRLLFGAAGALVAALHGRGGRVAAAEAGATPVR